MKHLLVFSTVLITVLTSLVLDYAAELENIFSSFSFFLIIIALAINTLKFGLWGWIHKHFDVSKTYPLTAIFFPIIFFVAYLKNEAEMTPTKIVGVYLIFVGIYIFEKNKKQEVGKL